MKKIFEYMLAILLFFSMSIAVYGQNKVTLNFENADIRYALKTLFNMENVNYIIDEDVTGNVTASLRDVDFRVALDSMLKGVSVPLTYRIEDGIYIVSVKKEENNVVDTKNITENNNQYQTRTVKIKLNYIDAVDLVSQLGGSVIITNQRMYNNFGGNNRGYGNNGFGGGYRNNGFGGGYGNWGGSNNGFGGGYRRGSFGYEGHCGRGIYRSYFEYWGCQIYQ